MLLAALVGLFPSVFVRADDPPPKADAKPQWQRLLTGDDARKAADLEKRIAELEGAGREADAVRAAEDLLVLRTRVQGADHWQAVTQKWELVTMKKVAALPAEKRRGWQEAAKGDEEAGRLEEGGEYAKALPLARERLKWCQEVLGEDHPLTAQSYNNVALNLFQQGKYAELGPLNQKALGIRRKVMTEAHPDTAESYNNIAHYLLALGKSAEAGAAHQKALDIRREVLGEGDPRTANSYDGVAQALSAEGKYAEADPLFQKALDIRREALGDQDLDTALSYNNVAFNLDLQGKYAEAAPLLEKALGACLKALPVNPLQTALAYNNLASNLQSRGNLAKAIELYRKALDIRLKVLNKNHPDLAQSYGNIASILIRQENYAEAEELFRKALDIYKARGEGHPDTARGYTNLAIVLAAQGKGAEAGPLYQKALDLYRKALGEVHPLTAVGYKNVAAGLYQQGKGAGALEALAGCTRSYEAARVVLSVRGRERGLYAAENSPSGLRERALYGAEHSPYGLLVAVQFRAGHATEAWLALEADLGRGLLDDLPPGHGLGLTREEQDRRKELRARLGVLEGRARALVTRPRRSDAESAELKRLVEERRELDQTFADLGAADSSRRVATLEQLRAALPADAAFVAWVDVAGYGGLREHWGCVVRSQGEPRWEQLPGSGPDKKWTKDDDNLPSLFRQALAQLAPATDDAPLAKKLHDQRLAPLARHLTGVKRLIVAPVNAMAAVPVEALTDQYTVSYTPSGTYLARLKDRERPRGSGALAVGDPLVPPARGTPPPTALPPGGLLITQVVPGGAAAGALLKVGDVLVSYAGEDLSSEEQLNKLVEAKAGEKYVLARVWREGQEKLAQRELAPGDLGVLWAKGPLREAIAARRQTDQMLGKLKRGDEWAELPGSQVEVAGLAKLFDARPVTTLTRAEASEERLDELRKDGKLMKYRFLHLATHGKANDVAAFESSLILTPPTNEPKKRLNEPYLDGRLTAAEVLEFWKLDADLVTLSACESGLGRPGGGDGLLGFAQAFLLAGSRSVCLTLWEVDDSATALLMDRFYRNLLGKREDGAKAMPKAEALREAKQWLRSLTTTEAIQRLGKISEGVNRGPRPALKDVPRPKDAPRDHKPYTHPRYWAAFILIGDPD
jgi:CHAT domain-containing protein/tetratricopeptide (TPR) repeat protein